jgi:hypothetical protein
MIWFDTPVQMDDAKCQQMMDIVKENQPAALVNSRLGQGFGHFDVLIDNGSTPSVSKATWLPDLKVAEPNSVSYRSVCREFENSHRTFEVLGSEKKFSGWVNRDVGALPVAHRDRTASSLVPVPKSTSTVCAETKEVSVNKIATTRSVFIKIALGNEETRPSAVEESMRIVDDTLSEKDGRRSSVGRKKFSQPQKRKKNSARLSCHDPRIFSSPGLSCCRPFKELNFDSIMCVA